MKPMANWEKIKIAERIGQTEKKLVTLKAAYRSVPTEHTNDWERLKAVTINAIDDCYLGKKFVNTRHLREFVDNNNQRYPELGNNPNERKARIYGSITRLGWQRYTSNGSNQSVFIDPRCGE